MPAGKRPRRPGTERHLCAACRERKALFLYGGHVRADRQHVLCFQCFRSARERMRAWQVREARELRSRALTAAQLEHRRLMLAHLSTRT